MKDTPMHNQAMANKLAKHKAVDVSDLPRQHFGHITHYSLKAFLEGSDYCDAKTERWIWSIGKRLSDGAVIASTSVDLYQNEAFECLWLR